MNVTVMENFRLGLQVTGMGMGLVFLTLVIIMYGIKLLDRAFRPKIEDEQPQQQVAELARSSSADRSDEAAAVAVAILLARGLGRPVAAKLVAYDQELLGNVVTVASIDSGPGVWKAQGRVQAMQ